MLTWDCAQQCAVERAADESLEPGESVVPGSAGGVVVLRVEAGVCTLADGTGRCEVHPGSLAVAAGRVRVTAQAHCRVRAVALAGEAAAACAATLAGAVVAPAARYPQAAALLDDLALQSGALAAGEASAKGFALLCSLAEPTPAGQGLAPLVREAMAEMQQHYNEVYGVAELAASLGVSKNHLIRSFTGALGVPPGQYLTAVRIAAAKRLLLHRDYPLAVVAGLCGFSGANYLCKVFKKETGLTPAAYRRTAAASAPPPPPDALEEMLFV